MTENCGIYTECDKKISGKTHPAHFLAKPLLAALNGYTLSKHRDELPDQTCSLRPQSF